MRMATNCNPLRIGVLGTASISQTVIPAMQQSREVSVVGVASRKKDRALEWAHCYQIPLACGSYDELLASQEVDAIYLPLPNALHADWTVRALEAGKPVLCEKPLTSTWEDACRVDEASTRTGLPVVEGFMYQHHPLYRLLQEIIHSGQIGRPVTLHADFSFLLDEEQSVVGSAPLGGGALLDVGCYAVHVARLLTGEEPSQVSALARTRGVDQTFLGLMDFPGGVLASFSSSIACAERHGLLIQGTQANLAIEHPWVPGDKAPVLRLQRHNEPDQLVPVPIANSYRLQAEHFARVVRRSEIPCKETQDALANMAAISALIESARSGRTVTL